MNEVIINLLCGVLAILGVLVVYALATNIVNRTRIQFRAPSLLFSILATSTLVLAFFLSAKIWISIVQVSSFKTNVTIILGGTLATMLIYVVSLVVIKRARGKKHI